MANPACLIGLCGPGLLGASLMLAAAASAQSPAVTSDFDRKVLELHFKQTIFGRPLAAPPNLPKDRLARLRQAFLDTMKDPEFLADAEKMKLDVDIATGEEVERILADFAAYPKAVIQKARAAIGR